MAHRILIIDDEDDIREILRHCIELSRDWTVVDISDPLLAVETATSERPDAILLDVMMPRMDGREVLSHLRQSAATFAIPVIFITASLQREDIRALEDLQPRGVLAKPFDPVKIVDEISELLGWERG